ncbi:hypothetical protein AB0E55_28745 [Amycolatopsis keratiniphila]|uniref:hypothetical protein n=1 Tax=Amycolatopsis keratiniphila TaxID=129921 RepID=UPI0034035694
MWTWRRKEPGTPPETPSPATLPVTRAEWRSLPPIQRVVAGHPLINPVQRFSSSLTSWRSPAYLEPLGHRVGPAEPSGVIDGLARAPVPPPDLPVVQRSARKRGVLSRLWGTSVQRAAEPDAPVSVVPEPEAPVSAAAHDEPLPDEPARAFEPTAAVEPTAVLVLPSVAAASRDADRPPMPLTSAGPSVVSARPPVRTVQAIRSETPGAPLQMPEPASEHDPRPSPMAPEPEVVGVATVPVPLPAEVATPRPGEPSLPVVQRTEQVEAAPRRLGLGAPILPDPVQAETPVVPEDDIAEVKAPLAGDVETSVLPTVPADPVPAEAPPSGSRTSNTAAVQRSVVESARELPSPERRDVPQAGDPVRKPVQRLRDESPVESGSLQRPRDESPGESSSVLGLVQRSGDESPVESGSVQRLWVESAGESSSVQRTLGDESPRGPGLVQRPVQRLRDESPSVLGLVQRSGDESPVESGSVQRPQVESPGEPALVQRALGDESPRGSGLVQRPVQRLRDEPPSILGLVQRSGDESRVESGSVQRPRVESAGESSSVQRTLRDEPPGKPASVQRSRDESPGGPTPVQRPVQRLRDEPPSGRRPVQRLRDESPREPVATLENMPIPVSRAVEPPPSLPTVTSSPGTTFHPPGPPRIRSGTTETPEPPGTPGGSASAPPAPVISTSPLPVARVVDGAAAAVSRRPTLTALMSNREAAPPIQRVHEPSTLVPETEPAKAVVQRKSPPPPTTLPVARTPEPRSTVDFPRTVQRSVSSEPVADVKGLVLNLPSVVVPRQPETPVVQREPETPPPPEPVAPPPAAQGPATAQAAPAAQPETEELVKKLFDPLLRRLKTELRLDRERRGALTDRPY